MSETRVSPSIGDPRIMPGFFADGRRYPPMLIDGPFAGVGGIASTARDLVQFMRANLNPGSLEQRSPSLAAALRLAQAPRFESAQPHTAGVGQILGWYTFDQGSKYWKGGDLSGHNSFMMMDRKARIAVFLAANAADDRPGNYPCLQAIARALAAY